ncbi:MAG: SOS response-associated peptidase [Shewanella xiamenensis]|nr:SOS response-associated peptidase [Shewanella xiamenensis]
MCGRLTIDGLALADRVSAQVGVPYHPQTNLDLRPTEQVTVIGLPKDQLSSINCTWGIKPNWSKSLLINAQAETVREKKTFANAFAHHRCVVPCSGWYEWRDEGGKRKQKYLFSHAVNSHCIWLGIFCSRLMREPNWLPLPHRNSTMQPISQSHAAIDCTVRSRLLVPFRCN